MKEKFVGITPSSSKEISDAEWLLFKEMNVKTIRVHLQKSTFGSVSNPDFSKFDTIISRAATEGIDVILLISYESYDNDTIPFDKGWGPIYKFTNCMDLIEIAKKAVIHFMNTAVCGYEIWNEQNGYWHLTADEYAQLLTTIYEKCKYTEKWDENAVIAFGGLDAVNVNFPQGINGNAKGWMEEFYSSKYYKEFKQKYNHSPFDAFCHHPYNILDIDENNQVYLNVLSSALDGVILDIMGKNGDDKIPLWITEYGDQDPNDLRNEIKVRLALQEFYNHPRVDKLIWFTMTYGGEAEINYSLVYPNGRKRPAIEAFREVTENLR